MRFVSLVAAAALLMASPAFAAQDGIITFSQPTTGGAPTGFRLYRDSVLIGQVVSGQRFTALFPNDVGTYVLAVESQNAACGPSPLPGCPRVTSTVVLGPPPLQPPGPVINVVITAPCATSSPPTCTINVTSP